MQNQQRTIIFTGGGTGGHVFPGLALAQIIRGSMSADERARCSWLWVGSHDGPEQNYVNTFSFEDEKCGFDFAAVPAGKLRRYVSMKNITDVARVLLGVFAARRIIKQISKTSRAACVVSIGGYVSVPTVLAARMGNIPIISVVCDRSPGLATKINARFSETLVFAYSETASIFEKTNKNIITAGLPLRQEITRGNAKIAEQTYGISSRARVLVALGGSNGSEEINTLVSRLLPTLNANTVVLHQTGNIAEVSSSSKKSQCVECFKSKDARIVYHRVGFFTDDYAHVLARADAALARGGAGTLWELAASKTPGVVVPLSRASSRGDQPENAEFFARSGTIHNAGEAPSFESVRNIMHTVLYDTSTAEVMRKACRDFYNPQDMHAVSTNIKKYVS